jgi:hypothetical protein
MNAFSIVARVILFSSALCLVCLPTAAFAADAGTSSARPREGAPAEFDIQIIRRSGPIFMTTCGDLDGNGEIDLLLFHKPSKESYNKSCSVIFQRDGKFLKEQPGEIQLGDAISAIDIEDIDYDGADDLCAFDGAGMIVFRQGSDASFEKSRSIEFPSLLPAAARQIAKVNWVGDISSDGRMDVVFPSADGLHLFVQEDDGTFTKAKRYEVPMKASVNAEAGQGFVRYRLPALEFSDFNNDDYADIGAYDFEQMSFFLTDGASLPERHVTAPLVQKFTKDFIGPTGFLDLNADGVPEAVLVLMSQKKNFQSEARIYFGKADLSYDTEPSNVYTGDTNVILPMFMDVTGDGKKEMLLQNINVGIGFFLNYFLRNRVRVDADLRKLGENGTYEDNPLVSRAIYVRASDTGTEPARGVGDFNGDGLDDLVVGIDEEHLAFFLSNTKDYLPRRPTFELDVPAYGKMKTLDLNDDSRTDIVILYPQEDRLNEAALILSR